MRIIIGETGSSCYNFHIFFYLFHFCCSYYSVYNLMFTVLHINNSINDDNNRETGSSYYNFHIFEHNYLNNEKNKTHNFLHETRWISHLIKISNSFETRPNIVQILCNKQFQEIVTTYPKAGVSCYTTWGELLHFT